MYAIICIARGVVAEESACGLEGCALEKSRKREGDKKGEKLAGYSVYCFAGPDLWWNDHDGAAEGNWGGVK